MSVAITTPVQSGIVLVSEEEYAAMTDAQKVQGILYFVYDGSSTESNNSVL